MMARENLWRVNDKHSDMDYCILAEENQSKSARSSGRYGPRKLLVAAVFSLAACSCLLTIMMAYEIYSGIPSKAPSSVYIIKMGMKNSDVSNPSVGQELEEIKSLGVLPPLGQDTVVKVLKLSGGSAAQCVVNDTNRFDCWPEFKGATVDACNKRGCCWQPAKTPGAPYCYFPSNYPGYTASNIKQSPSGVTADLSRSDSTFFPPDVKKLKLQIEFQTESRLRIKIFDPTNKRFEPPVVLPQGGSAVTKPQYKVRVTSSPFNIVVTRASNGATIFDTTGMAPFIFADQFMQIGTKLSTQYLYGLGEHRHNFRQELSDWRKLVFWNRDSPPSVNDGYGTHPFFLNLEPNTSEMIVGQAHGVLLLNSNAGDVALQPSDEAGAITYRYTGGVFDFYLLLGDSPLTVSTQYARLVGAPYMPPFWSLGFHLCKYGIKNQDELRSIISRNRAANIPYDVQWNDIDYMDQHRDWTISPDRYANLPSIVEDLHKNKQRYIIMADPAISSSQPAGSYPPFDDGKAMGIFVKKDDGSILIGKVWPGETAFPDFFHPRAYDYWYKQAKSFHDKIPFDGLWIDMNEPSSFIDGSKTGCSASSKYDNPPYVPGTIDGGSLVSKTICSSAKQHLSAHYNLHNMYGWSQANVSRSTLNTIYGNKRSPMITRSSFVSSGRYTGHWLGDNFSSFPDLAYSIAGILNFNLFGIPLIGADICGFNGDTNPELCTRWHQLGVFYPFMRNHASLHTMDQDPASFSEPYVGYIRKALQLRYRLLAVLYTGFFNAHTKGLPIVRPLFYVYPGTESVAHQFMWNDQLLVSPVVTKGATNVEAFIPKDIFYDFYTGAQVIGVGKNVTLKAPIDSINVHIRGGSILPLLPPTERTDDARQQKFNIVVAYSKYNTASGELFWDDGESADSIPAKKYSLVKFELHKNNLISEANPVGYTPPGGLTADTVTVLGVTTSPHAVTVNGKAGAFKYDSKNKVLQVQNLSLNLLKPSTVSWT